MEYLVAIGKINDKIIKEHPEIKFHVDKIASLWQDVTDPVNVQNSIFDNRRYNSLMTKAEKLQKQTEKYIEKYIGYDEDVAMIRQDNRETNVPNSDVEYAGIQLANFITNVLLTLESAMQNFNKIFIAINERRIGTLRFNIASNLPASIKDLKNSRFSSEELKNLSKTEKKNYKRMRKHGMRGHTLPSTRKHNKSRTPSPSTSSSSSSTGSKA